MIIWNKIKDLKKIVFLKKMNALRVYNTRYK